MRKTMESLRSPFSSHIFSTLSMSNGRYYVGNVSIEKASSERVRTRSDSAMASPQVGKATHAEEANLKPE